MKIFIKIIIVFLLSMVSAAENTIKSIKYDGLHRLTKDALTPWVSLEVGDDASDADISNQIKQFYSSQYFESIASHFDAGTLTFTFKEEPIVSAIAFEGNTVISDKELEKLVENIGLKPGRPLDPTKLKGLVFSLSQYYQQKGYLDVAIKPDLNRSVGKVSLQINIEENSQFTYNKISFEGNTNYSSGTLKWHIGMDKFGLLSWLNSGYVYSEDNYNLSIQKLYDFYYDRGYLDFEIITKKVDLNEKNHTADVHIKLFEGQPYRVTSLTIDSPIELPKSVSILQEAIEQYTYSKGDVIKLIQMIQSYLKDMGYAYAVVTPEQKLDHEKHEVSVNLKITPEKIYHIRNINFHGNDLSNSDMLRRYLRQNEGQRFSQKELEASKNRLLGLDYFDDVAYKINPVPGFSDQVDIDYELSEKSSVNSILGEVGWGKNTGLSLGADLKFKNFFGTGNQVILGVKSTKSALTASLSHVDPFYTDYGVSRSTKIYYSSVDTDSIKASDYKSDNLGLTMSYGIPVSRYAKFDVGFNVEQSEFKDSTKYAQQVTDFINEHGNSYTNFAIKLGLGHARYEDTYRNRFNASLEVGLPLFPHELTYYTMSVSDKYKVDLYRFNPKDRLSLELMPKISYGQGYDSYAGELPFFKRYHAGGFGTVRNYRNFSLGPKDSNGDVVGGDLLTVFSSNLYFPVPFVENNPFETAFFFDIGNVYKNDFDVDDLKGSYGFMFLIRLGQMPIGFSVAKSINEKAGDEFNTFDFALGLDF